MMTFRKVALSLYSYLSWKHEGLCLLTLYRFPKRLLDMLAFLRYLATVVIQGL
jgi:hypothetical protein